MFATVVVVIVIVVVVGVVAVLDPTDCGSVPPGPRRSSSTKAAVDAVERSVVGAPTDPVRRPHH